MSRETSEEIASVAGRVMNIEVASDAHPAYKELAADAKRLAGSALSQREPDPSAGRSPTGIHPGPDEFDPEQVATNPILRYFHYRHLPPALRQVSAHFCDLAVMIVSELPSNAERSVALRKLLEAKDAAVRANIAAPTEPETFYSRLLNESRDLEMKIEKLDDFLAGPAVLKLSSDQQRLLHSQATAMHEYASVLGKRIALFQPDGRDKRATPEPADEIGEVRITGGDKSEEPIPFD